MIALAFLLLIDLYVVALLAIYITNQTLADNIMDYVQHPFFTMSNVLSPAAEGIEYDIHKNWLNLQVVYLGLIALAAMKLFFKRDTSAKDASDYGAHGTARWANDSEIKNWWHHPLDTPGLFLGKDEKKYCIHPESSELNQHAIVFGGSGTGKSRSVIIPNILKAIREGKSIVVTDTKGTVYNQTANMLRKNGYTIRVLNYLKPKQSSCYNRLDFVKDMSNAIKLSNTIIENSSNKHASSDEMWRNAEQSYITACILYVKSMRPPSEQHMSSVLAFGVWGAGNPELMDFLFSQLPYSHPAKQMYDIFRIAEDKTRTGILIGFASRLQVFLDPGIAQMWSKSDFDLKNIGLEKTALFLLISDRDTTYKMPLALTWAGLFQDLLDEADGQPDGVLPVKVKCLMDECANIGTINNFEQITSTARSRGVEIVPIFQSLPQLKNRYDKERWAEIMSNMDTILYLGTNDLETAKYFSQIIGPTTLMVQSYIGRDSGNGGMNENYVGRPLMQPSELRQWDRAKMIVLQNGKNPAALYKVDYTELDPDLHLEDWRTITEHNFNVQISDYGKLFVQEYGHLLEEVH